MSEKRQNEKSFEETKSAGANVKRADESFPLVSIIIPVRNEEEYLGRCLESIAKQTYPHDKIEVLVVNGHSTDSSTTIATEFGKRNGVRVRILDNHKGNTPCGLNIGYKNADGEVFVHFIGHAMMSPDFIAKNMEYLDKTGADAVGGLVISACLDRKTVPQGIGYALNSLFGLGGVMARTGTRARYIDNPSFAAYRRELFDRFGYIDERLTRNQDYEFNQRISAGSAKIYFTPDIRSSYFNRPTYKSLWKEYFNAAKWRSFMIGRFVNAVRKRHLVPPLFVLSVIALAVLGVFFAPAIYALLVLLGIYSVVAIGSSLSIGFKKGIKYVPSVLLSYLVIHVAYGFGFIWGIVYFWIFGKAQTIRIAESQ